MVHHEYVGLRKRNLTLVDKDKIEVQLTLWNNQAETYDEQMTNPVIAIKNAKLVCIYHARIHYIRVISTVNLLVPLSAQRSSLTRPFQQRPCCGIGMILKVVMHKITGQ